MHERYFEEKINFSFQIFLVLLPMAVYLSDVIWSFLAPSRHSVFSHLPCFPLWYVGTSCLRLHSKYPIIWTYTIPIHTRLLVSQWFHDLTYLLTVNFQGSIRTLLADSYWIFSLSSWKPRRVMRVTVSSRISFSK